MASQTDPSVYYVPHNSWYPVWAAIGMFLMLAGLGFMLNDIKAGEDSSGLMMYSGMIILAAVLFFWFAKVIECDSAVVVGICKIRAALYGLLETFYCLVQIP